MRSMSIPRPFVQNQDLGVCLGSTGVARLGATAARVPCVSDSVSQTSPRASEVDWARRSSSYALLHSLVWMRRKDGMVAVTGQVLVKMIREGNNEFILNPAC